MIDRLYLSSLNPRDAAAEWLVARDRGLSAGEQDLFDEWLVDPVNRAEWERAEKIWDGTGEEPDVLVQWMRDEALMMRPPVHRRSPVRAAGLAAAVVACVVVGFTAYDRNAGGPGAGEVASQSAVFEANYDAGTARRTVELPDGSRAVLDAGSRLAVREDGARRALSLSDGRAFFVVAHDTSRPFVVSGRGYSVTATGTQFSVDVRSALFTVVLAEGKVRIAAPRASAVDLTPGQRFEADQNGGGNVGATDPDRELAWRDGYIRFDKMLLRDAVAEMNRYAKHPIQVASDVPSSIRVSGRFRTDSPDRFAQTLCDIYPLRMIRRQDGSILLSSKGSRR